jgi:nucleotide-binding universal stress UspA family protein
VNVKVLVAVDGSEYSRAAVSLARALRIGRKAEVTILTVIPEHVFLGGRTLADLLGRSGVLKTQMQKAEEEKASELLGRVSKSLAAPGLEIETMIRRGSPADEIIKTCRSVPADLVLVGFKGTSDSPEFPLGNVAHKVIRYAPCSVLVAKRRTEAVNRVLVPLDGSKHSDETVQFLLSMSLPPHAEVLVMAVLQSFAATFVKAYTLDAERDRQIVAELQEAEEEAAKGVLTGAESELRKGRYTVSTVIARGDPAREILREAGQRNVDLIALGAKGLTGVRGFMLGSVAQRVARYGKPSVLIVRPSGR